MMRLKPNEKQYIETIANIAGVSREDTEKVFQGLLYHLVLELYDRIDSYNNNELIDETIVLKIPYFLDKLNVRIQEHKGTGGIEFDTFIDAEASDFFKKNIKQTLSNENPDVMEKVKLEIFKGLDSLSN
jgi:hypothetical protein